MTPEVHSFPRRQRGSSTVAVSIILSVAALLILTSALLVLSRLRDSVAEENRTRAQANAEALLERYEAQLAADPYIYLTQVDVSEWDRVCGTGETATTVTAGAVWPANCGTQWNYSRDGTPAEVDGVEGRLEVTAPGRTNTTLQLRAVGRAGAVEVAVERTYILPHAGRYGLWVAGDLNLGEVVSTAEASFRGDIYVGGNLYLPIGEIGEKLDRGVVLAEGGIYPAVPDNTATAVWAEGVAVRERLPSRLNLNYAWEQVPSLRNVACGPTDGVCLTPGRSITTSAGTSVAVPENFNSVAIRPVVVEGVQLLEVWTSENQAVGVGECLLRCSLPTLSAPSVTDPAGHPGVLNSGWWTPLGTFHVPASGVVYSSGDIHVGGCGVGFTTAEATCVTSQVDTPLLLVAGERGTERDIWIGGPITGNDTIGLVATGGIRVPHWSRPPGGDLEVKAAAVGMSTGLVFTPEVVTEGLTGNADSQGGKLTWEGSVVAAQWPERTNQFRQMSFTHNPGLFDTPPPYMVGFGDTAVHRSGETLIPAADLCGGSCFAAANEE